MAAAGPVAAILTNRGTATMRAYRWMTVAFSLTMFPLLSGTASAQSAQARATWNVPTTPFRLFGNVHYVGTAGLSAFLITGPNGHVLIDGALPESAPLIAANIERLGFRLRDVKYLLINHSHVDHAGGLAELKRRTGARLVAGAGDRADLESGRTIGRSDISPFPAVRVDRVVRDGDRVTLGPIVLTAIATPGHTRGATSWAMESGGRRVVFVSSISVADQPLVGNRAYPTAAADFRATFAKLRATRADVYLSFHGEGFDLKEKRARLAAGRADAFVDPGELGRRVDAAERGFTEALAAQRRAAGR